MGDEQTTPEEGAQTPAPQAEGEATPPQEAAAESSTATPEGEKPADQGQTDAQ